ncbi:type IV toxin-antitoxin system AbiEi family antitoxin domain-containing protein [Pseudactinotalea sp. HY158]|uniref:type IV toxin-antitoxin system AbiEi family antitoxin domain-containing protein n=1 Tax=Pseudactinotalea sp. HY158 TaxID=2654547 RepID=UPI0018924F35|nr:type IV toxin-antitoxin system AbiEi family antitoxin domain-containing protein [Pseudactinotalea sp. HY158]
MNAVEALRTLAGITAYQWGMVTAAQAGLHGVSRLDLSRLAQSGHLKRLAHGVYMDGGAPSGRLDDLRAAWLSTNPRLIGEARLSERSKGVVIAASSAARLHGIGDLWTDRHEFVSPARRQSQRSQIRYRLRALDAQDVTLVEGLPVMTLERTIADLVEDVGDLSLVSDALRDASKQRDLDLGRLTVLLGPLAHRHGFAKGDGAALLERLQQAAGIDPDALADQIARDPSLGPRTAARYLSSLNVAEADLLINTARTRRPEILKSDG